MVEAGRDLWRSSCPTPCSSSVTCSRLPNTMFRWLLNISRDGDSTTSIRQPVSVLSHAQSKKGFPDVHREPPVVGHHWKEPASTFFTPSFQRSMHIHMHSSDPPWCFSKLNSPTCQPFLIWEMLQSLNHRSGPLLDTLQYVHLCLALKSPELDTGVASPLPSREEGSHPSTCWQYSS